MDKLKELIVDYFGVNEKELCFEDPLNYHMCLGDAMNIANMYKAKNEWITISESLPQHSNNVPVLIDGLIESFAYYNTIYKKWCQLGSAESITVTHWFDLYL